MIIKQIYKYAIRPVLIIFAGSFLLDTLFDRDQDFTTRIIRAVIFGLILGLIMLITDKIRKKSK